MCQKRNFLIKHFFCRFLSSNFHIAYLMHTNDRSNMCVHMWVCVCVFRLNWKSGSMSVVLSWINFSQKKNTVSKRNETNSLYHHHLNCRIFLSFEFVNDYYGKTISNLKKIEWSNIMCVRWNEFDIQISQTTHHWRRPYYICGYNFETYENIFERIEFDPINWNVKTKFLFCFSFICSISFDYHTHMVTS